jgi:hypothetical protein
LGIILTIGGKSTDKGAVFIIVFVIVWFGGLIVTLNCQFLGSKVSVCQSICVLGYCIFPIDVAALLLKLLSFLPFGAKLPIAIAAFIWSSICKYLLNKNIASVGFMSQMIEQKKKILATYPIFLFYLFLSWFILAQ